LGGHDGLIHVMEHREPVRRAADLFFGPLPLGDIRDHADRSDQCSILP
jgi:hypothetical protein